jgi:hypothetical protein
MNVRDEILEILASGDMLYDGAETCSHDDETKNWRNVKNRFKDKYAINQNEIDTKGRELHEEREREEFLKKRVL